jgi:hypothetical protein
MMNPRPKDELLREFLHERDARCPACRYSLRNCGADRCPECGAALEITLAQPTGKGHIWWSAAMAGSAMAAGIALLMLHAVIAGLISSVEDPQLLQMIAAGFAPQSDAPQWKSILLMLLIATATLACAVWMLAVRRRFSTLGRRWQEVIGIAGALSPFMLLGVLYLLIRYAL